VRGAERFDLRFGEVAGSDDKTVAAGEFEEDREEVHGCSGNDDIGDGGRRGG
jgi:hypothetical protein